MSIEPSPLIRPFICLGLIALAGVGLQIAGSRFGIGVSPDTIKYVRYAKMLLGQEPPPLAGVTRDFLVHFPPLFPAVLAAGSVFHANLFAAARVIQSILFAVNILFIGMTSWLLTGRSLYLASLCAVGFIVFGPTLTIHLWGWSEPLFIFMILCTFACLVKSRESPSLKWILLASGFAAAAMLTRYAGLAIIPCGAVLFRRSDSFKSDRSIEPTRAGGAWKKLLLFFGISILPLAAFLVHNKIVAGKATNRVAGFYEVLPERLREGALTFHDSFVPMSFGKSSDIWIGAFLALVTLAIPAAAVTMRQRQPGGPTSSDRARSDSWLFCSLTFEVSYLGLIVSSILFYDPLTPLDARILSPLAAPLMICVGIVLSRTRPGSQTINTNEQATRSSSHLPSAIALGLVILCAVAGSNIFLEAYSGGLGFRNQRWRRSETLAFLASAAPVAGQFVFSNEPDAVYAVAGRTASGLAVKSTVASSSGLTQQLASQVKLIHERGIIVYLEHHTSTHAAGVAETLDQVEARFRVRIARRFKDGAILVPTESGSAATEQADLK